VRLGSVVAPTPADAAWLRAHQVPWSLNVAALAFTSAVVRDDAYLARTWELTAAWRARTADWLAANFPGWTVHGKPFLSWLWVDTHDVAQCERACAAAKAAGVPMRSGKPGYEMPTFVRIAVRCPQSQDALFAALKTIL
jgi:histidinol-phosphate/aromatic aminotransferase/cobyric acid decarboxylase-like protein